MVEQSGAILAVAGCLNFFAGPGDTQFSAMLNFYDVHYKRHAPCRDEPRYTDDMREAIAMMNAGRLNPAAMVTHIGGLDAWLKPRRICRRFPAEKS